MASRIGQQLGNYRILQLLGKGGFAEVYLGEHIHLGTQAAIKILHTQINDTDAQQFRQEARTIARLIHPHIVRVLEFGVEDTTPFMVMDYAPNGTLRQRHPTNTPLSLATVVSYVKQTADALQYAHNNKLIHRDVKPENMLIGNRGEILLSDFGIALVSQSSRYQGTQDMAGTIAYMAPEQIQSHPRSSSDQYALGIVVYEWLTGERPFHGSFTEIAIKHTMVPPPPIRATIPTVSSNVEQVVMTALAKDPKDRFANVQAFSTALEQASQGIMPTYIKPASPVTPVIGLQGGSFLPPTQVVYPQQQQYAPPPPQYTPPYYGYGAPGTVATPQLQQPVRLKSPAARFWLAVLIGGVAGVMLLLALYSIRFSSTYILAFLILLILLPLVVGAITGRAVVKRSMGFPAGFMVGVPYVIWTLLIPYLLYHQIYYLNIVNIGIYLIACVVLGLLGLFAAWLATIGHPYYKQKKRR